MANLTTFKTKIGYGVRPNLFEVTIPTLPTGFSITGNSDVTSSDAPFKFLCRSAGIPAASVGTVEVPFRGRVIKLPGDRTFESWTITMLADESFNVRGLFEKWMDSLNEHTSGAGYTSAFSADLFVTQLKRGSSSITGATPLPHVGQRTYKFCNAFPTNISQIDLSYDNNNSVAEYTVEFQYDWWEASNVAGGASGAVVGGTSPTI